MASAHAYMQPVISNQGRQRTSIKKSRAGPRPYTKAGGRS